MRLENTYQGITLNLHFDSITKTYIGYLEGLAIGVSVQATDYEDLVDAFHEAVDLHASDRFVMSRLRARHEQEAKIRPTATAKLPKENDPYSRRQFLR